MYAVVQTGGKQYKVQEGETLRVEKLPGDAGATVCFDNVLLIADGQTVTVGRPCIEKASVSGRIVEQDRAKKILVFKYKRRKRYRRMHGHRQAFSAVRIEKIHNAAAQACTGDASATVDI